MLPMIGRLPLSRSPPQPNTHDEPAGRERAQRLERGGQRIGLVRVVDDDEAAAHSADDLEPALHALELLERGQDTRSAGSPAAMARPAASSALEAW